MQTNKLGIEGVYLNKIKVTYDKTPANIILTGKKVENFFFKIHNKRRMLIFTTSS